MLWLWCRPAPTAQIRHVAWEPSYATGAALKTHTQKKKKKKGSTSLKRNQCKSTVMFKKKLVPKKLLKSLRVTTERNLQNVNI